jgi:hypothetical protein
LSGKSRKKRERQRVVDFSYGSVSFRWRIGSPINSTDRRRSKRERVKIIAPHKAMSLINHNVIPYYQLTIDCIVVDSR